MVRSLFLITLLFSLQLFTTLLQAQQAGKFTLVVKSPSEITKHLGAGEAIFFKESWASKLENDSASYEDGAYKFTGHLEYPTAIRIFPTENNFKFNELLFIDTGYQEYKFVIKDSSVFLQRPPTKTENEVAQFLQFMNTSDFDQKLSYQQLSKYISKSPTSYIALYALINQTFSYDFDPYTRVVVSQFNPTIWDTKGFKHFESQYLLERTLRPIKVSNNRGQEVVLNFKNEDGKLTLLEFWFAGCKGCIPVMQELRDKYYPNLSARLKVIGICTDSKEYMAASQKVLDKIKPQWDTYWDYNAKEFDQHALLYSYPANMLLNKDGKVIAKNIDLSKLSSVVLNGTSSISKEF